MKTFKFLREITDYWIRDSIIMYAIRHTLIHRMPCYEYSHSYFEGDATRMYLRIIHINHGADFVEIIFETTSTETNQTTMHIKEYDRNEFFNLLGEEYANI